MMIGIIITSIIAFFALIVSIITLRENFVSRKPSFRPWLIPERITEFGMMTICFYVILSTR